MHLLNTKGHCGYTIFLECLKEEQSHAGHCQMVSEINKYLDICCSQRHLLREVLMRCSDPSEDNNLSRNGYFEVIETFMHVSQNCFGNYIFEDEIQLFITNHNRALEAKAIGLMMKALIFNFQNNADKLCAIKPEIEVAIDQINDVSSKANIQGHWYLMQLCWYRHLGNYPEARTLLKLAEKSSRSGHDHACVLFSEASLLIQEKKGVLEIEERQSILSKLQGAMNCFHHKSKGISIMEVRCQLREVHCHIGSSLSHPHNINKPSQLEKADSILVKLEDQLDHLPLRLQMQFYVIKCDYYVARNEKQQAMKNVHKGLHLDTGRDSHILYKTE